MARAVLVLALASLGCGARGAAPPAGDPGRRAPAPVAADARAEAAAGAVTPRAYALELAIDPEATGYTGTVRIDVELAARTRTLSLHGRDLQVDHATVTAAGAVVDARALADAATERLVLELADAVGPGPATIEIAFAADYRTDDAIFAQSYRGRSYVFSDFEPIDARRAFPCFDEPRWKTPWTVSLVVPEALTALSNMPAARSRAIGRGLVRVDFDPTPPLPSYLVAIAVGAFDLVTTDGGPVPVRIVVPSGRAPVAARAAAFAPELLETARAFLDRDVPFPKLDIIAVPRFGGAMENPGLVTVAADILLDARGDAGERKLALVLAHEIAHLWFGDAVTLGDWRDLWLQEGLASWMADELLARWRPGWDTRRDELRARAEAMRDDALPGAHPLRPEHLGAPRDLFDVLTYQKSAALLHAIEDWVGADRFLDALRGYLDAHAGGTVTTADLLAVLAPLDAALADALPPLLTRAGVPAVEATLRCDAGAPRLALTVDDTVPALPVCVRWDGGGAAPGRACAIAGEATAIALGDRCPAWVHPNADGTGYYRWTLDGGSLAALIGAPAVTDRERLDATFAIRAALEDGAPLAEIAAALRAAARADVPEVVAAAIAEYRLLIEQLAPAEARPPLAAHLRAALAPTVRRLGTRVRAGEPADDRRLRPIVLAGAGALGGDPRVLAWARRATRRWLRDRTAPDAGLLEPALLVAAAHADDRLAADLRRAAEGSLDEPELDAALLARALGRLPPARARRVLAAGVEGELPSMTTFALAVELLARADTARDAADLLAARADWLAIGLTFAEICEPDLLDRLGAADPATAFGRAIERRRVAATRCDALRARTTGAARAFAR